MLIKSVTGQKIIASQGDETIQATLEFDGYPAVSASVPAGISAGKYEVAKVTPDEAISQIGQIDQICSGKDWTQKSLDTEISSHNFGGNTTLAVSAAFYKATFKFQISNFKFPRLMLLLFEGGLHGNSGIAAQEFLLIEETIAQAKTDYAKLKQHLADSHVETLVGAEGGFSPAGFDNTTVLALVKQLFPSQPLAVDVAGSFNQENLDLAGLFAVEDPYDDESWDKFAQLTASGQLLVIGDDLTVTNPERIKKALELKAVGGVVVKPNQIGTISQAKEAVKIAKDGGLKVVVSHRGDDTDDTWIADFAVDVAADFVKFGGMERGERIAKYNRLTELGMT